MQIQILNNDFKLFATHSLHNKLYIVLLKWKVAQIESSFNKSPPTQSKFWMKEEYKDIVVLDFFFSFSYKKGGKKGSLVS